MTQEMGDGIMALFGAPLAHEDHAVRACYAALRMQESVKRYAEQTRWSHGVGVAPPFMSYTRFQRGCMVFSACK